MLHQPRAWLDCLTAKYNNFSLSEVWNKLHELQKSRPTRDLSQYLLIDPDGVQFPSRSISRYIQWSVNPNAPWYKWEMFILTKSAGNFVLFRSLCNISGTFLKIINVSWTQNMPERETFSVSPQVYPFIHKVPLKLTLILSFTGFWSSERERGVDALFWRYDIFGIQLW